MNIKLKYIVAPDIFHLEARVNAFLASAEAPGWMPEGIPQVMNHECFVQMLSNYSDSEATT